MKNKDLVDLVFNQIKKLGYKPYDIEHPDGYFICDYGKDSVTHFRLKGHGMWKHWQFGLWCFAEYTTDEELEKVKKLHEDGDYEHDPKVIYLFAQHDTWIDKFKPSRSALCVSYDAQEIIGYLTEQQPPYLFHDIKNMLKMMCKHPLICYAEFCGEYTGYYADSFLVKYIKYESQEKLRKIEESLKKAFWGTYTKIKIIFAKRDKCIDSIELYDFKKENPGWGTDYLYEVRYVFTKDATQDEECRWLDRWWHKTKYGKYGYCNYAVRVDMCRKIGKDGYYWYEEGE